MGIGGPKMASRETLERALMDSPQNDQEIHRARIWTRAPILDAGISFTVVILVTLMFAMLGSSLLHSKQLIPDNQSLLSRQEAFLTSINSQLLWVYRVGVFLAFIGTLYGTFEIYRHTVVESARAIVLQWSVNPPLRILRFITVTYCHVGGMTMLWLPKDVAGDVVGRMTSGAVISGPTLSGRWCFAMLWTDFVRLPRVLRMGRVLWWSTFIAGLVMTVLGVQTMIKYFS